MTEGSLDIQCPACGGPVTAQLDCPDVRAGPTLWTCPYCNVQHSVDFGARLRRIVKRRGKTRGSARASE
jgi:hypothetical protein